MESTRNVNLDSNYYIEERIQSKKRPNSLLGKELSLIMSVN